MLLDKTVLSLGCGSATGLRGEELRDRASGEVVWEFPVRDRIDSSPVLVRNRVIFGSDDGRIYGVDPATGEEAWSYQIGAPIKASPALAEGKIVIGAEDGVVYAFEFR